jgi:hypothetical protein
MTLVVLSSKDRSYGTSQNGIITLSYQLDGDYKVKELILVNSIYSVNNSNNKIYFAESSTDYTATIQNGTYSSSQLAVALKECLDLAGELVYTITYNENTNKYKFTANGDFGFKFSSFTLNSARFIIGKNAVDDVESTSQNSDNSIDLTPYKILYVNFPEASNSLTTSSNVQSSMYVSSVGDFGGVIRQNFENDDIILKFNKKIQISYTIHDANNNEIDLNGSDWEIVLIKK